MEQTGAGSDGLLKFRARIIRRGCEVTGTLFENSNRYAIPRPRRARRIDDDIHAVQHTLAGRFEIGIGAIDNQEDRKSVV